MTVDLNTLWFILVGMLLTGYAVLDGFDLGTGPLLLCTPDDTERRIFLNAIGPIWNGNEVWLVTGGGALFAAFPEVYATVFSGFYDAFMILLAALIFRATAIEFRSHQSGKLWRHTWDWAFAGSSLVSSLLFGIAWGNIVSGIPLDSHHEFHGDLFSLLSPYALGCGLLTATLFIMHANVYLVLKTEGDLQAKLIRWTKVTVPIYLASFVVMATATLLTQDTMQDALRDRPVVLGVLFALALPVTFNILREVRRERAGPAFLSSCLAIILQLTLFGVAIYPHLIFSVPDRANDLTIYNGSSTQKTLAFMAVVALIGVPLVLTYTGTVYYVFRGKVVLTEESY